MPRHSNRPMGVTKLDNEYIRILPPEVYADIPKAVWAAIAISLATCGGDRLDDATRAIVHEWGILSLNGIVPQDIPASLRKYNTSEDDD